MSYWPQEPTQMPDAYFDASGPSLEDTPTGWDQSASGSVLLAHVGDVSWPSSSVQSSDGYASSHGADHAFSWSPTDFFDWEGSPSSFPIDGSDLSLSPSILGDPLFLNTSVLSAGESQGSASTFFEDRNINFREVLDLHPSMTVSDHAAMLTSSSFTERTPSVDSVSQPIMNARPTPGWSEWPHYVDDNLLTSAVPSSSDLTATSAAHDHPVLASTGGQSSGAGAARRIVATTQQQKAAERRRSSAGFSAMNHAWVHENKQEFACELGCGRRYNTEALRRRHYKKCARKGTQPGGDGL
ncbi:hypothetical protein K523DRAFT_325683 [Schizophyllum commune Tattone D]|nr:hypothetical protein K523DRAFT_325683 [Schizophyllum commune Tattone D]